MKTDELTQEELFIITLRDEIYGTWEEMIEDLEDRLTSRPYLRKLTERIQSDIAIIQSLKERGL